MDLTRESPTWDVVATVRADPAYVARFVAAYRNLGAAGIHIFHDDPQVACAVAGQDATVTVCDDAYWAGQRPDGLEDRQTHNATRAAARSGADWLLHCDIDEIVWSMQPVASLLGLVPQHVGCLRVFPVEAVFAQRPVQVGDIFGTAWFKSMAAPLRRANRFWWPVYQNHGDLTNGGFLAHRAGKSFLRLEAARSLTKVPLHKPLRRDRQRMSAMDSADIRLRHFDALLPDAWAEKHLDRASGRVLTPKMGPQRERLAKLVADRFATDGMEGVLALYDQFYVVPEEMLQRGLAERTTVRIDPQTSGLAMGDAGVQS